MNQYFRDRVLILLHDHGLIDTLSDDVLSSLTEVFDVTSILGTLFPERYVWFDAECVYEDDVFEDLVGRFAQATLGEWAPEHVHSTMEGDLALIDFDERGEHVHWAFEQASKWVSSDFTDAIDVFAEDHLSGAFVVLPVGDQCHHAMYLPKAVTAGVEEILQQVRQEWPNSEELIPLLKTMVHEKPWLWHDIRTNGNDFRLVNVANAQGELPLHVAVEAAAHGDERALSILKGLLRKGASPTLADGRGRTAFDAAAGNAAVVAVLEEAVAHHGHVKMDSAESWTFR